MVWNLGFLNVELIWISQKVYESPKSLAIPLEQSKEISLQYYLEM